MVFVVFVGLTVGVSSYSDFVVGVFVVCYVWVDWAFED